MNNYLDILDNQSIISDITDVQDNSISSFDLLQKQEDVRIRIETELNKLTIDLLKDKCKELNIGSISKFKKPELVQLLLDEFLKLVTFIKGKTINELKSISKQYNIKYAIGSKKDERCFQILNYCSDNLKFKIDEVIEPIIMEKEKEPKLKQNNTVAKKKINPLEELEKQKLEIEIKMKEEIEKQRIIEDELKRKKQEDDQKRIDDEKKLEKEEAKIEKEEAKKKKQSIPKNVRIIVWNHYIGEDLIKHRCLCCKKVLITNTNFEVGHVLSEKNGGSHEINNLRPICFACNHSMGSENMIEFVVKYGLYIG